MIGRNIAKLRENFRNTPWFKNCSFTGREVLNYIKKGARYMDNQERGKNDAYITTLEPKENGLVVVRFDDFEFARISYEMLNEIETSLKENKSLGEEAQYDGVGKEFVPEGILSALEKKAILDSGVTELQTPNRADYFATPAGILIRPMQIVHPNEVIKNRVGVVGIGA